MDVANRFFKIDIFLAEDGLVPILEEMTGSGMPPVEPNHIPGQEPTHNRCDRNIAGLQQQMKMVADQAPGKAGGVGRGDNALQPLQKIIGSLVVREHSTTFNPSCDDMVQGPWGICSSFSRHAQPVSYRSLHANIKI
jgi:hypothetical protein